jgi:diguanylate cyclase (GGDEF)-like protein
LDGIAIGPGVGSCGTAAALRKPVAVEDIFSDPLWAPYQRLAEMLHKAHGVQACWSSPIIQSDGRVLGAFGFYYKSKRGPTAKERAIVAKCVDLCALVLERDEARAENKRLTHIDLLTGLGNRANFIQTLGEAYEAGKKPLALLLIDIDSLGHINDISGQEVGDRVIRKIGQTIARIASPGMTFRVDADEFAVLVEGTAVDLSRISAEILQAVGGDEPSQTDRLPLSVTCGGTFLAPSTPCDASTFLQRADLALQHAKQTARGRFVLYSDDLTSAIAQRFRALQTVTSALAENRIEAHYQPIIRLDTREIIGLEALCRVRTHDGKIISAGQLVEAMEDLTLGNFLTDRMLALVARDIRYWLDQDIPLRHVGVNVSMADFLKGNLHERIVAAFKAHGAPLEHIVIEVTESVYMDGSDRIVARAIEQLRGEGLLVALDDFGTGFASLTHLLNFPVDMIKIDRSFVAQMATGRGEIVIKALLDMATGLGLRVVAEGVETAEQAIRLEHLGCVHAQGYLFGHAATREQTAAAFLRRPIRISA